MSNLIAQAQTPAPPKSKSKRRSWRWKSLAIIVVGLTGILLLEVGRVAVGPNFHQVIEGRLYRAAQPSAASLERYIHAYGIRTVINLRGPNPGEDWFDEEERVAKRCGVDFISVNMSASDKPQEQNLKLLIETFEQCPTPILLHCTSGSDRSGFASACYLLLKTATSLAEARSQLSLRFGHFGWGRAGCLNQVLDQYEGWLRTQSLVHHPEHFRHWATAFYQKDDWPK